MMWEIVRRFLKMGMLKLAKQMHQNSERGDELPSPPIAKNGHDGHPANQTRSQGIAPKPTGFAARRDQMTGSSFSK
jgi:hypothetical protein